MRFRSPIILPPRRLTRTLRRRLSRPQFVGGIETKARKKAKASKAGSIVLSISDLKKAKRAAEKAFQKYKRRCDGILDLIRCVPPLPGANGRRRSDADPRDKPVSCRRVVVFLLFLLLLHPSSFPSPSPWQRKEAPGVRR